MPMIFRSLWITSAAFCSLVYQLTLGKEISHLIGIPLLWECLNTGAFLLGMGIASFRDCPFERDSIKYSLARVELRLALLGICLPMILIIFHFFYRVYFYRNGFLAEQYLLSARSIFGILCLNLPFWVGYLSGREFRLVNLLLGAESNFILTFALYYLGSLLATVAFVFYFHPDLSSLETFVFAGCINLALFLVLGFSQKRVATALLAASPVLAIAFLIFRGAESLQQFSLKNFYYNKLEWVLPLGEPIAFENPSGIREWLEKHKKYDNVEHYQSSYQSIDLVRHSPGFQVHIDYRLQFDSTKEAKYHERLVHIPAIVRNRQPKRVLIVGGGDGMALREVLRYNNLEKVLLIDIDSKMTRFATEHPELRELNQNSFLDPKLELVNDDAFYYLRHYEGKKFDSVIIDLTYPFNYDSSRFYTVEFLRLLRRHLTKDGIFSQSTPLFSGAADVNGHDDHDMRHMMWNTLRLAGFHRPIIIFGRLENYLIAQANDQKYQFKVRPFSFQTKYISPRFFDVGRWEYLKSSKDPQAANRLWKPTFLGLRGLFL